MTGIRAGRRTPSPPPQEQHHLGSVPIRPTGARGRPSGLAVVARALGGNLRCCHFVGFGCAGITEPPRGVHSRDTWDWQGMGFDYFIAVMLFLYFEKCAWIGVERGFYTYKGGSRQARPGRAVRAAPPAGPISARSCRSSSRFWGCRASPNSPAEWWSGRTLRLSPHTGPSATIESRDRRELRTGGKG